MPMLEPWCEWECVRECDGDWTRSPWFLEPEAPAGILRFGFSRDVCEAALPWLKWAYPVEYCRKALRGRSEQGRLLMALYLEGAYFPHGLNMLQTGWLMHMAQPRDDLEIRSDLRQPGKYASAVQELEVRAQLVQAGLQVSRAGIYGKKRPEYEVHIGAERYFLEVKRQGRRDDELAVERVEEALTWAITDIVTRGYHCYVRLTGRTAMDVVAKIKRDFDRLIAAFDTKLRLLKDVTHAEGRHPVDGYGYIELVAAAEPPRQGGVEIEPPLSRMRNADRARRSVQAAIEQLPVNEAGAVILDLNPDTDFGTAMVEVARYLLVHPDTFPRCRFVMLRCDYANHWDPKPWGLAAVILNHSLNLTEAEQRIARALCGYAGYVDVVQAIGSRDEAQDPSRGIRLRRVARLPTPTEQQNAFRISLLDRIWAHKAA